MLLFTLAFLFGDLYLQTCSFLPDHKIIFFMIVIIFFSYIIFYIFFRNSNRFFLSLLHFLMAALLGFTWTAWYAQAILSWSLPKSVEGKNILITGIIASLPSVDQWQQQFQFKLEKLQYENPITQKKIIQYPNSLIRLNFRNPKLNRHQLKFTVGDRWQFVARLKRIHSTQNPGAFDYEAWSLQKGLRATGYVISHSQNQLLSQYGYEEPINRIRQSLQEKINLYAPASTTAPWLMALIIGERNNIAQSDWQILRKTGTNHLMAIAGLHIGLMAGFAHTLIAWCWRRVPYLTLRFPAIQAGACAALIVAILYSALAGFLIPTQRACLMLAIFILAILWRRKINAWHAWALALLIVLILNPLNVLTESFWLSFGTIALIIYGMSGRLAPQGWWWHWGRVQWVIGLGLIPLTLTLFQEGSFISFVANSIAIPWLAFFILPFCLLSAVFLFIFPILGAALLWLADQSLAGLWYVLTWFAQLPLSAWHQAMPNHAIFGMTLLGCMLLLLPAGVAGRWLGIVWFFPLIFYQAPTPPANHFWVTLLDVGQGLSVVVQTQSHLLIYDTGAKYNDNANMGEQVILPYLRTLGVHQIDRLVISHGDNDHIGGADSLLAAFSVRSIKTSEPEKLLNATPCVAGEQWEWDGVRFSFLYPAREQLKWGNNSSCVLRIENQQQSILLTGDIEKIAEKNLLSQPHVSTLLNATMLVAPHHGSKTSALPAFVEAVHPQVVLYAIGYRNRYHFPHKSVVAAYRAIDAMQLNTAESGAIEIKMSADDFYLPLIHQYRLTYQRYWMDA